MIFIKEIRKTKRKKERTEGTEGGREGGKREGDRPNQPRIYNLMWPLISINLETTFYHI